MFDSDADGRPGFMILGLTHDVTDGGTGKLSGTHEIVGVYCVAIKVALVEPWVYALHMGAEAALKVRHEMTGR